MRTDGEYTPMDVDPISATSYTPMDIASSNRSYQYTPMDVDNSFSRRTTRLSKTSHSHRTTHKSHSKRTTRKTNHRSTKQSEDEYPIPKPVYQHTFILRHIDPMEYQFPSPSTKGTHSTPQPFHTKQYVDLPKHNIHNPIHNLHATIGERAKKYNRLVREDKKAQETKARLEFREKLSQWSIDKENWIKEQARLKEEAERLRREEERKAEEHRRREEERKAEEHRRREEERKAEEHRRREEERKAEEHRQREEAERKQREEEERRRREEQTKQDLPSYDSQRDFITSEIMRAKKYIKDVIETAKHQVVDLPDSQCPILLKLIDYKKLDTKSGLKQFRSSIHPDRNKKCVELSTDIFQKLNPAIEFLLDPHKQPSHHS